MKVSCMRKIGIRYMCLLGELMCACRCPMKDSLVGVSRWATWRPTGRRTRAIWSTPTCDSQSVTTKTASLRHLLPLFAVSISRVPPSSCLASVMQLLCLFDWPITHPPVNLSLSLARQSPSLAGQSHLRGASLRGARGWDPLLLWHLMGPVGYFL